MPTNEQLRSGGYSDEEIKSIRECGPYAALIFGCELPGEAPQTYGDLLRFGADVS